MTTIRYGRRVYANLRKAIVFVLAAHLPIIGLALAPLLLGWPLILMPAHILFLQLLIDPACSIVFEAQALEPGAMRQPPRRTEARLFDAALVRLALLQGVGLLVAVLAGYVLGAQAGGGADAGRTVAFTVMVLGNLGLIQANRSWSRPAIGPREPNAAFRWIVLATSVLLVLALGVPQVASLFQFTAPSAALMGLATGLALAGWAWCTAAVGRYAGAQPLGTGTNT